MDLPREVELVLAYVGAWAPSRPSIAAIALVGSHARGGAQPDSDVDLVLLTDDPPAQPWPDELEAVSVIREQWWGTLREHHLRLPDGLVVEVGVAPTSWAAIDPVDAGTLAVVGGVLVALHDPIDLLADLLLATTCSGSGGLGSAVRAQAIDAS